jgi:hypothetical protein
MIPMALQDRAASFRSMANTATTPQVRDKLTKIAEEIEADMRNWSERF